MSIYDGSVVQTNLTQLVKTKVLFNLWQQSMAHYGMDFIATDEDSMKDLFIERFVICL